MAKPKPGTSMVPPRIVLSEYLYEEVVGRIRAERPELSQQAVHEVAQKIVDKVHRAGGAIVLESFDHPHPANLARFALIPALRKVKPGRSLRRMERWNDLLPTAGLRKQTKKMIADQQAHVEDLVKQGRERAARWQVACTWVTWGWYVLKRPITALSKTLQGKVGS